jgi:adhesin transport system membrane fusion protein
VQGIVKNIKVNTIGGVIAPNGELMEIVPVDGRLLIEARISPRDIAFIHPDQQALVKITAYDYAIYGALNGVVETISPDTTRMKLNRMFTTIGCLFALTMITWKIKAASAF